MVSSISNIPYSEEKVAEVFDIIKDALKAACQLGRVKCQTAEIRKALKTTDYDVCFDTAQNFLRKYRKMINSYTFLTGVVIINISPEEARSKDITFWQSALRFTEMLIYANEAINCGLESVVEKRLKKLSLPENETGVDNRG